MYVRRGKEDKEGSSRPARIKERVSEQDCPLVRSPVGSGIHQQFQHGLRDWYLRDLWERREQRNIILRKSISSCIMYARYVLHQEVKVVYCCIKNKTAHQEGIARGTATKNLHNSHVICTKADAANASWDPTVKLRSQLAPALWQRCGLYASLPATPDETNHALARRHHSQMSRMHLT